MPTSALLLALGAALVHAVWNVLLARARDPRAATAVALLVAEVVFAIPALLITMSRWSKCLASSANISSRGGAAAGWSSHRPTIRCY